MRLLLRRAKALRLRVFHAIEVDHIERLTLCMGQLLHRRLDGIVKLATDKTDELRIQHVGDRHCAGQPEKRGLLRRPRQARAQRGDLSKAGALRIGDPTRRRPHPGAPLRPGRLRRDRTLDRVARLARDRHAGRQAVTPMTR